MTSGLHIRNNRLSGDIYHLNEKAVKVLATIKFAPSNQSLEEIKIKTSLTTEDVERQVKLLLRLNLLVQHHNFPVFPNRGWRVYTISANHNQIIAILRRHGYQDEPSSQSRESIGYYPTGYDLEKKGIQPNSRRGYPLIVPVNEDLRYRAETMRLMERWKNEKHPFKPKEYSLDAIREKTEKFQWLTDRVAVIYGVPKPRLAVMDITPESWNMPGSSGSSSYNPNTHTITIYGKFSVLTFLHEWGHVRGFDEVDTTYWSVNLFKRVFPVSYSKLKGEGHTLQQTQDGYML